MGASTQAPSDHSTTCPVRAFSDSNVLSASLPPDHSLTFSSSVAMQTVELDYEGHSRFFVVAISSMADLLRAGVVDWAMLQSKLKLGGTKVGYPRKAKPLYELLFVLDRDETLETADAHLRQILTECATATELTVEPLDKLHLRRWGWREPVVVSREEAVEQLEAAERALEAQSGDADASCTTLRLVTNALAIRGGAAYVPRLGKLQDVDIFLQQQSSHNLTVTFASKQGDKRNAGSTPTDVESEDAQKDSLGDPEYDEEYDATTPTAERAPEPCADEPNEGAEATADSDRGPKYDEQSIGMAPTVDFVLEPDDHDLFKLAVAFASNPEYDKWTGGSMPAEVETEDAQNDSPGDLEYDEEYDAIMPAAEFAPEPFADEPNKSVEASVDADGEPKDDEQSCGIAPTVDFVLEPDYDDVMQHLRGELGGNLDDFDRIRALLLAERVQTWKHSNESGLLRWFTAPPASLIAYRMPAYHQARLLPLLLEEAVRRGVRLMKDNDLGLIYFARVYASLVGTAPHHAAACLDLFNVWAGTAFNEPQLDSAVRDTLGKLFPPPPADAPMEQAVPPPPTLQRVLDGRDRRVDTWTAQALAPPSEEAWQEDVTVLRREGKITTAGLLQRPSGVYLVVRMPAGRNLPEARDFLRKRFLSVTIVDGSVHATDNFDVEVFGWASSGTSGDRWLPTEGPMLQVYECHRMGSERRLEWMAWRTKETPLEPQLETLPRFAGLYGELFGSHYTGPKAHESMRATILKLFEFFARKTHPEFVLPSLPRLPPAVRRSFDVATQSKNKPLCSWTDCSNKVDLLTHGAFKLRRVIEGITYDFCCCHHRCRFDLTHPICLGMCDEVTIDGKLYLVQCQSTSFEPVHCDNPLWLRRSRNGQRHDVPRHLHSIRCTQCGYYFSVGRGFCVEGYEVYANGRKEIPLRSSSYCARCQRYWH